MRIVDLGRRLEVIERCWEKDHVDRRRRRDEESGREDEGKRRERNAMIREATFESGRSTFFRSSLFAPAPSHDPTARVLALTVLEGRRGKTGDSDRGVEGSKRADRKR